MLSLLLKVLPFVFIVPGVLMVYLSKWAVEKYSLDKKVTVDFENEFSEEELEEYKFSKASVNMKMFGLLLALPGIVLLLLVFR